MLILGERWSEALDTFRAIGVHAREFPWAYIGDSRKEFLEFRLGVRMQVASRTPFFSRPPQSAPAASAALPVPAPRSLAIAAAPPHQVAEAALMCGVSLRIAPAPAGASYVELVPDPSPAGARRSPAARSC